MVLVSPLLQGENVPTLYLASQGKYPLMVAQLHWLIHWRMKSKLNPLLAFSLSFGGGEWGEEIAAPDKHRFTDNARDYVLAECTDTANMGQ